VGYPDLDEARQHHAALKHIISRHAGEAPDLRALRRVVDLCRGAADAVNDEYCRTKIRLVAEFACEMLSHGENRRIDFLKQQIINALELFQSRLYSLEAIRRAGERGHAEAADLRPPRQ